MKTFIEKTETRLVLDKTICDICGNTWDDSKSRIDIELLENYGYPENPHGIEIKVDMCPTCFKGVFKDWLESIGVTVEEKEWG